MRQTSVDDQWSHSSRSPEKKHFSFICCLYPFHLRIDFQRGSHYVCMKSYMLVQISFWIFFCQTNNKLTNRIIIIPSFGIEEFYFFLFTWNYSYKNNRPRLYQDIMCTHEMIEMNIWRKKTFHHLCSTKNNPPHTTRPHVK